MIGEVIRTFVRGVVYAVSALAVFLLAQASFDVFGSRGREAGDARIERQWRDYDEQHAKSQAMFDRSAANLDRQAEILAKQEDLLRRFEVVIKQWEDNGSPRAAP